MKKKDLGHLKATKIKLIHYIKGYTISNKIPNPLSDHLNKTKERIITKMALNRWGKW